MIEKGLSSILEKKLNDILVTKLRVILLLEADFSIANKIIFNTRMILDMEKRDKILYEIVGWRCLQSAIHITINKKIIADITN